MLFRATTHMGFYERALEERGIPTHVVGGRGYWAQQQVADLRHWLAALANPLDELAVYSVLASPLAGLSLDAVALIGLESRAVAAATPGGCCATPDELDDLLPAADRRRAAAFVELFEAERRMASQVSLETLIDRAVTRTGYDRHILALRGGRRRMANVRKLMRMAREFEADEGRDLRGFIDTLAERDEIQSREGEAPLEAEALDAVRLMTVHRAKGLEFPVVCVADLGKEGREDYGRLRISDDGMTGLRLADARRGVARQRPARRDQGAPEGARGAGGAAHLLRRGHPRPGAPRAERRDRPREAPRAGGHERADALAACAASRAPGVGRDRADPGERGRAAAPRADRVPVPAEPEPAGGDAQPELGLGTLPGAARAAGLAGSPTAGSRPTGAAPTASTWSGRCACRGRSRRPLPATCPRAGSVRCCAARSCTSCSSGSTSSRPRSRARRRSRSSSSRTARPRGRRRSPTCATWSSASPGRTCCARIARAGRVRTELPFAFTLAPPGAGGRSLLVNGVVDVHAVESDRLLVVDYKSDALDGRDPVELTAESYSTQRLVYALAGLRSGAERVEVVHCFLEQPERPAVAVYEAGDADRLEEELLDLAAGVVDGRFEPAAEPHRELCGDCPGRAALCSWDEQHTLRSS